MAQLELATTRKREFVTIDGKDYQLGAWDDLDLDDRIDALRALRKLAPEQLEEATTKDEIKRACAVIERLVVLLLPDLPSEILTKLNFAKRDAIVAVAIKGSDLFTKGGEDKRASPKTPSPLSSKGSMGGRRKTGKG